jgi:DNA-binding GntR family transcriptional regulator
MEPRTTKPGLLYEYATEEIRREIFSGAYGPGDRLRETELANSLNLSRGPIREALRQLHQEGLLEATPQRGFALASPAQREIFDALVIREFLETLNIAESISQVTEEDIAELEVLLDSMIAAETRRNVYDVAKCDFRFHERLLEVAASRLVQRAWHALATQIRLYLTFCARTQSLDGTSVAAFHRPIVDALRERDAHELRAALRHDVKASVELVEHLSDRGPRADGDHTGVRELVRRARPAAR